MIKVKLSIWYTSEPEPGEEPKAELQREYEYYAKNRGQAIQAGLIAAHLNQLPDDVVEALDAAESLTKDLKNQDSGSDSDSWGTVIGDDLWGYNFRRLPDDDWCKKNNSNS